MKTLVKVVLGLGLSAVTLWLFLRNLDFAKVRDSLAGASPTLLVVAILLGYFGHLLARSRRWATMLEPLKRGVSFYNLFSTTAIGYAISWLAPGRIGEVVRPVMLARRESLPVAGVLATAGIERMLDGASVVLLAAAAAMTAPLWWAGAGVELLVTMPLIGPVGLVRLVAWLGAAGLLGCVVGALIARGLVREGSAFLRFLDSRRSAARSKTAGRIWDFSRHLAEGAFFLRDLRRSVRVGLESLLVWLVIGVSVWIALLAAGVHVPFPGVFLLLTLTVLGIAVPTPGGAGSVHFAFQWGLTRLFGVETNLAAAATVLYHPIIVYIPPVVFGLLFAWRDGLSVGSLKTMAAEAR